MLKSEKYFHPSLETYAAPLNRADDDDLNLGKVGQALRRRALLIVGITGVVAAGAVLKAKMEPPVYKGTFEILTKPVSGEGRAVANLPQTLGSQGTVSPPELEESVDTTIAVLQSRGMLEPVIKKLQDKYQKKYPELDLSYESVLENFIITPTKQNILEIEYTAPEQEVVRNFLKLVADAYLEYSLKERQADINQAIVFVNKQVKPIRGRVESWQDRLRTIRQVNNMVEPAQKSQEVSGHIATLTQQQLENRSMLEQMRAKYFDLQKELAQEPGEAASNSLLSDNPRYQKILDQLLQLNADISKRGSVFTDDEEGMKRLNQQKAASIAFLQQERQRVNKDFQSRIRELEARDLSLSEKINNLNKYVKSLANINRDYDNIQQELKIASENLNQFLAKQQALEIEKAQKQQPWKLLDPKLTTVRKPEAVSDSAKIYLVLGAVLGSLLGVGAALVVDKLSNVFYTAQDLKDSTRLPLLGIVPLRKELGAMAWQEVDGEVQQAARASFFEVFRSLYTNILLLGSDTPIRSLVISSPAPEDGKTTVAVHLALAAAAMGHRVLLVDANLRTPIIHNLVGLMNIQGLTDVISQDLDWNNVIERSPLEDNLFVLTAGPTPPDPIRLLASQKMQDLMNQLQSTFDLVIYDTPPLMGFADANLLAANTNGLVLTAGLGKLKRTLFQQSLEELQVSGTPILGVIANKSKDATTTSYSYYQQYYKKSMSAERVEESINSDFSNFQSTSSGKKTKR